jgi:anthranilate synthase/aminodeoxychorismate synthase-like glutamine amidotransferase
VILLLDNHDSFVYNLARYVRELGEEPVVHRCDRLTLEAIATLAPSHIIVSPGPGTPTEARLSVATIQRFGSTIPILGVCLGHQCIGAAYGASITRARVPVHGKASPIWHDGSGLFDALPCPFVAARYHSLVISREHLPQALRVTATADDGEIMGVAHAVHPVVGLQFHPESVLSAFGYEILDRFLHGRAPRTATLPAGPDGFAGALRQGLDAEADAVRHASCDPAGLERDRAHPPLASQADALGDARDAR